MEGEQPQIPPVTIPPKNKYARIAAAGCLVVLVLGLVTILLVVHVLLQIPRFSDYKICCQNATVIGAALVRYATKNDAYPDKLEQLYPDYIEDRRILHCPSDPSPVDNVSYEYMRPSMDAPDDTIILVCKRHVLFKGQPPALVAVQKDGQLRNPAAGVTLPPGLR